MRMMEVPVHQIIDVVAMRNRLVSAIRAMSMRIGVAFAGVRGSTPRGVPHTDFELVLVKVIPVLLVQMSIVQKVRMIPVLDRGVPTTLAVYVGMSFVNLAVLLQVLPLLF
jgi:hypothetical protein